MDLSVAARALEARLAHRPDAHRLSSRSRSTGRPCRRPGGARSLQSRTAAERRCSDLTQSNDRPQSPWNVGGAPPSSSRRTRAQARTAGPSVPACAERRGLLAQLQASNPARMAAKLPARAVPERSIDRCVPGRNGLRRGSWLMAQPTAATSRRRGPNGQFFTNDNLPTWATTTHLDTGRSTAGHQRRLGSITKRGPRDLAVAAASDLAGFMARTSVLTEVLATHCRSLCTARADHGWSSDAKSESVRDRLSLVGVESAGG